VSMLFLTTVGAGWTQSQAPAGYDAQPETTQSAFPQDSTTEDFPEAPPEVQEQGSFPTPPARSRSYLLIGVHAAESGQNDPSGVLGYSSQLSSSTNVFGSVRLRNSRRRFETAVDYMGGGDFYTSYGSAGLYEQQEQQLSAEESILWPRARLTFSDLFRYAGEGSYGASSFGGGSAYNLRFDSFPIDSATDKATAPVFVPNQLTQVGSDAYTINVSSVDLSETLTPRSLLNVGGSYAMTNYVGSGEGLFNSRQASGSMAYSYVLTPKDTLGALYGYQAFEFPSSGVGRLVTNSIQATYHHTITGRMELLLSGGPEFISLTGGTVAETQQTGLTAQAALSYQWKKSNLNVSYNRQVSSGSGYFAGAITNVGYVSIDRSFSRSWQGSISGGYTRATEIGSISAAIGGSSFDYAFASAALRRRMGRYLSGFVSYQYDGENFASCLVTNGCNPVVRRHIVSIGFDWYIRPIRLE